MLAESFLGSRAVAGLLSQYHPLLRFNHRTSLSYNLLLAAVAAIWTAPITTVSGSFVNRHSFALCRDALLR